MAQADFQHSKSELSAHAAGARAFHLATEMEDDLLGLEQQIVALRIMAGSDECKHNDIGEGIYAIVHGLERHFEEVKEKWEKIFHLTNKCAHSSDAVQASTSDTADAAEDRPTAERQTQSELATERKLEQEADNVFLDWIATWHVARQKAELRWAELNAESRFGTREYVLRADEDAIEEMESKQSLIADMPPGTVFAAWRAIEMALTILEFREFHPEHRLANGPAVKIIQNALSALGFIDGRIPLNAETLKTISVPGYTD